MNNHQPKGKHNPRTDHLDVRFTPDEKKQAQELAAQCGLSLSNYIRKRALGYQPKARLTLQETEALNSLCTVRGDLVHFKNVLSGLTKDERMQKLYRRDFLIGWMNAIAKIIERWNQIIQTALS